jgi:hypothetical protein
MDRNKQIKSKERVANFGEVFTSQKEVNAMLDLVKNESERIESRFLEPACGEGVFLAEVLKRKLKQIKNNSANYNVSLIIAVSSCYGIDIIDDNVDACIKNMLKVFKVFSQDDKLNKIAEFILKKNIVCGDALTLKDSKKNSIVFSEWTFVENYCKRKDFSFESILESNSTFVDLKSSGELNLFSDLSQEEVGILPKALKDFGLINYLEIIKYE